MRRLLHHVMMMVIEKWRTVSVDVEWEGAVQEELNCIIEYSCFILTTFL